MLAVIGPKIRRLAQIRDRQRLLKSEGDALRDDIARMWPCPGESLVVGDEFSAKLSPQKRTRLNLDEARKVLTAAQLKAISTVQTIPTLRIDRIGAVAEREESEADEIM